ncbi:5-oxoprolinase subunit PxpB [Psychroserpens mesophilus]|uniref:5-oxoprolinase subunit PxpB n=1 Tax=Psychroserpens mesophilus TaxID=325473 RepID=UPI00058B6D9E|nr:5-oxoprolinase subunit PxpB [Psychroserpens mesophilus]
MTDYKLTYHHYSERSILVQWPQKIDENILDDVLIFKNHIINSEIKSILQVNNAYNSILIIYVYTIDNINDEFLVLKSLYSTRVRLINSTCKLWKIPVCYDDAFGIDLDEISKAKQLSKSEIIKLHSEVIYTVFFIGFLPGFLYLGGLDKRLFFPRKESPRLEVKKGSVAIGNEQTGIYPNFSPAGWNIIGNSPLDFFNAKVNDPCFAQAGDKIQFIPIDINTYYNIKEDIQSEMFSIENKVIDG